MFQTNITVKCKQKLAKWHDLT